MVEFRVPSKNVPTLQDQNREELHLRPPAWEHTFARISVDFRLKRLDLSRRRSGETCIRVR